MNRVFAIGLGCLVCPAVLAATLAPVAGNDASSGAAESAPIQVAAVPPMTGRVAGGAVAPKSAGAGAPPACAGSVTPPHLLEAPLRMAQAAATIPGAPQEVQVFMSRVFQHIPEAGRGITSYRFEHWAVSGKPTEEAVGLLPVPGIDADKLVARVMDVDHYVGPIAHVSECRSVPNPAFKPPKQVEFYELVNIPLVGNVQQELVLVDAGVIKGYRVAYWYLLKDKTNALPTNKGARSDFNVGAWLVAPGVVGYTLSSWPKRDDVNWVQWKAMTSGADVAASSVIEGNIKGMSDWAKK